MNERARAGGGLQQAPATGETPPAKATRAELVWSTAAATALLGLSVGGYIAGIPLVQTLLPAGPIALGALGVVACLVLRPKSMGAPLGPVLILLPLGLSMSAGFAFATDSAYGIEKSIQMATLVPLSLCGGALLLHSLLARRVWVGATIAYAVLVAVLLIVLPDAGQTALGRLSAEGSNTIAAGRAPAAAVVVLIAVAVAMTRWRVLSLVAAGALTVVLLASGSRGPLLAVVIAVLVCVLAHRVRTAWIWILVIGALVTVAWQYAGRNGYELDRLTLTGGDSIEARRILIHTTLSHIAEHPLGSGWGTLNDVFASVPGVQNLAYPHNILLEAAGEAGVLGALALLGLLVLAVARQWSRSSANPTELALLGLLVFFLVSALVSGDLSSNRGLWVVAGAALVGTAAMDRPLSRRISRPTRR